MLRETALKYRLIRERFDGKIIVSGNGRRSLLLIRCLSGNEKYKYLKYELPEYAKQVNIIHAGDIMLYGSDCIVIFYKDFKTSYSYTRLGKIIDPAGLEKAVTKGKIKVKFSIVKKKAALNRKQLRLTKGSSFQLKLIN